ncbi:cytochrome c [bacterium]|nr:cytochrome c [bacterium]
MNTITRQAAPWAALAALALAAGALHSAGPGATPVASALAASGQEIYLTTCFACHGQDGKGALPGVPDLTDPAGRLTKPDAELFASMRDGLATPGTALAMPARGGNPDLTDDDLLAVLGYVRSAFGSETAGTVSITINEPPPMAADLPVDAVMARPLPTGPTVNIGRGAQVWAYTCNRCHNLRDPREFTDIEWKVVVAHMKVRAGLTGRDADDILAFLKASN